MSQIDMTGIVIVAFETEIFVADWLVARLSPTPIATAANPAVTHMIARRIEPSLPCESKLEYRTLERGIWGDV